MPDPTKLYAVTRDRNGQKRMEVVGTVAKIPGGGTEIYFEHTPTGNWGWKAYLFPAGAEFPELEPPSQQPKPAGEVENQ